MVKPQKFSYAEITQCRKIFSTIYSNSFADSGGIKTPLKVGIIKDLRLAFPDIPRILLKASLNDYCCGLKYHKEMLEDAARCDLDGNTCGRVTKEQAEYHAGEVVRLEAYYARLMAERDRKRSKRKRVK